MSCRWDTKAQDYLRRDGTPCRHDAYGDPTTHCTARRRCSTHIGPRDLTCPSCVGRVRRNLVRITDLMALMPAAAVEAERVDTEVMNLAAVAGDPVIDSWRRIERARVYGGLIGDPTDQHPATILGGWQQVLSEGYGHDLGHRVDLAASVAYLDRVLVRVAQDPQQDFPLLLRETTALRMRLESVLAVRPVPRRGLPCPWCDHPRRMIWIEGHVISADWWRCPSDREHWMTAAEYDEWAAARTATRRGGPRA